MPIAMPRDAAGAPLPLSGVRLRTLIGLRWFAVLGQLLVTVVVSFGLGFALPLGPLLAVIAAAVWVNVYAVLTRRPGRPLSDGAIMAHLAFDTLQISGVLFLTGGIQNPFVVWLVMPAMLAAASLARRKAAVILALVGLCLTGLAVVHEPLPWRDEGFDLPWIYDLGLWAAMMLAVAFTASYAQGVALAQARLATALAATQEALAKEERLSALDGLAAAAAHELGTPLGTIQVTAREMERELEGDLKEDAALLISQTQRCQAILRRLSAQGEAGDAVHGLLTLDDLLRTAAAPFLDGGPTGNGPEVAFRLDPGSEGPVPARLVRRQEVIYGLRNVVENAAKYARETVSLEASWDARFLTVRVSDDGPGFAADVLRRLGEPYPRAEARTKDTKGGLGLGFFIAKTLLERSGARLSYGNAEGGGAYVEIVWPLASLTPAPSPRPPARPVEAMAPEPAA